MKKQILKFQNSGRPDSYLHSVIEGWNLGLPRTNPVRDRVDDLNQGASIRSLAFFRFGDMSKSRLRALIVS